MNRSHARIIVRSFATLVLAAAVTLPTVACASSKEKAKSESVSAAMTFRDNLNAMPANIDRTMAALNELRAGNNTNRAASFQKFSEEFAWMQNRARELGAQADKATADSQKYFRAWVAESMKNKNASERQAAEERIASRKDLRDQALTYLSNGRTKYQEFANRLLDLQSSLRNNLTQGNIDALAPQFTRAAQDSIDVKNYIDRLDEQIDAILSTR